MTSSFMSAKPHGLGKAKGSLGCWAVEQSSFASGHYEPQCRLRPFISLISTTTTTTEKHTNETPERMCELTGSLSHLPFHCMWDQSAVCSIALKLLKYQLPNLPLSILKSSEVIYLDSDSISPLREEKKKKVVKDLHGIFMQKSKAMLMQEIC